MSLNPDHSGQHRWWHILWKWACLKWCDSVPYASCVVHRCVVFGSTEALTTAARALEPFGSPQSQRFISPVYVEFPALVISQGFCRPYCQGHRGLCTSSLGKSDGAQGLAGAYVQREGPGHGNLRSLTFVSSSVPSVIAESPLPVWHSALLPLDLLLMSLPVEFLIWLLSE